MDLEVLTQEQVEHFMERGYVQLPRAFAREDALAAQGFLWNKVEERGVLREDRSTWTQPMVHIQTSYKDPLFDACDTPRLKAAIEDLVGRDRWRFRDVPGSWGWWPVNFPQGPGAEWDVRPRGWHWDGQQFRHFVNSGDQGLLLICCFSDVQPRGGGTLIAPGSHQIVARFLAGKPEGVKLEDGIRELNPLHPWLADLSGALEEPYCPDAPASRIERFMDQSWTDAAGTELRVEEVTCEAGDVFLCHPFLYHSVSTNLTGEPRFMCNRTTELKGPLQLERPDADYSPLEESIRRALAASGAPDA